MTVSTEERVHQSLHFSRSLVFVFVSFWCIVPALGRAENPKPKDEFADFDNTPKASTRALVTTGKKRSLPELESLIKNNPEDSKVSFELADLYFGKKEYAKVPPLLWKFIDQLGKRQFYILLRSHNELGQGQDLLRATNLLISKNEKDFEAYHYQGKAHLLLKKRDGEAQALESFKKALVNNPKYLPSYLSIASIYEKRNNLYELRALYQDMMKVFGQRPEILNKLCWINVKDGMNDTGEQYCRLAIQKDPENPDNHVHLGLAFFQLGEREKGKDQLKKAAEKFKNSEVANFEYASALEADKNYIDSYKFFKTCSTVDPTSDRCRLGLANSAFQIQKLDEALSNYKSLCIKNRSFNVHVRRGVAALRGSGANEAAQKFQDLADQCSN